MIRDTFATKIAENTGIRCAEHPSCSSAAFSLQLSYHINRVKVGNSSTIALESVYSLNQFVTVIPFDNSILCHRTVLVSVTTAKVCPQFKIRKFSMSWLSNFLMHLFMCSLSNVPSAQILSCAKRLASARIYLLNSFEISDIFTDNWIACNERTDSSKITFRPAATFLRNWIWQEKIFKRLYVSGSTLSFSLMWCKWIPENWSEQLREWAKLDVKSFSWSTFWTFLWEVLYIAQWKNASSLLSRRIFTKWRKRCNFRLPSPMPAIAEGHLLAKRLNFFLFNKDHFFQLVPYQSVSVLPYKM